MTDTTPSKTRSSLKEFTPAECQRILENYNTHNRRIVQTRVDALAREMKEGNWHVNGATIAFNGDGGLLDGQHRLAACVKAGVPFTSYVVRGIDTEAQATMDLGGKRTLVDILHIDGVKSAATAAAITVGLLRLKHMDLTRERMPISRSLPFYHKHSERIDAAAAVIARGGVNCVAPGSALGVCVFAFPEEGEQYAKVFKTGVPFYEKGDPALALREAILKAKGGRRPISTHFQFWTTIKMFNAFKEATPAKLDWVENPVAIENFDAKKL